MTDPTSGDPQGGGASSRGRGAVAVVIAIVVGAAIVAGLATRGRVPPPLGATLEHAASLGGRDPATCLSCHRPDGPARPRSAGHTPRQDCWNCHALEAN